MLNNVMNRIIFYFFILLFHSHIIYSSSSNIVYPSFKRIVNQLTFNSTLPQCTASICQANFSHIKISDEYLFKLSNRSSHRTYLIASTGIYRGKQVEYNNRYIDQFLGIYYAEIPGSLKKPVKKRFNYTIQDATKASPCCMQSTFMAENLSYGSFVMQRNFDDNCLSLNIYRADLRSGEKRKAIMLFSHGGSNQLGSGSLFDGSILASEGDIIVITMNFRLNYHGFLSSGDKRVKGNYGLWDQLLAVEWIYENAHLFGGDPHRIVLAGHSAGAGNVMLIPASPYCRGMIRRVISQSGTGLAPWSINHNPMKLLERFANDFNCKRSNENEMIDCVYRILATTNEDIYRLHLSLSIADDNPYPVIDNDFINDTIENLLQSDAYKNIDFLTGVTLNEGLYFAEYHIKHLYSNRQTPLLTMNKPPLREKRENDHHKMKFKRNTNNEVMANYDPYFLLENFVKLNYIERYIDANFQHGNCFMDEVKEKYELSAKDNSTHRLKLYIDLVSDLMFNFHMVRCLNLRAKLANRNSSNYAYVYSHRPTPKVRSVFRDHLKLLPNVIGHFAELDYVFGVPLARDHPRIHENVNMSYYNYSNKEKDFSRQLIRYWSNFIKTGNPSKDLLHQNKFQIEWKSYTESEHNYLFLHLNNTHNEPNYFDTMYNFWLECFQIEHTGGCKKNRMPKSLISFIIVFLFLLILLMILFVWKYFQKKRTGHLSSRQSPTVLLPYPSRISA